MSFLDNLAFEAGVVARSVGRLSARRRAAARRHRAVALGQDGVRHLARQQSARAGAAAGSGGVGGRAHRQGASSIRSPTTPCRVFPTRSIWRRSPAPTAIGRNRRGAFRNCGSRIDFARAAGWSAGARAARPRHRRLSRRMAARPHAARQILRPLVERDDRGEPRSGARGARRRAGSPISTGSIRKRPSTRTSRARRRGCSPNICSAARADVYALSTLPPGRFLMPGDLEGSPALTFAPLAVEENVEPAPGSLAAMMERRYEFL